MFNRLTDNPSKIAQNIVLLFLTTFLASIFFVFLYVYSGTYLITNRVSFKICQSRYSKMIHLAPCADDTLKLILCEPPIISKPFSFFVHQKEKLNRNKKHPLSILKSPPKKTSGFVLLQLKQKLIWVRLLQNKYPL